MDKTLEKRVYCPGDVTQVCSDAECPPCWKHELSKRFVDMKTACECEEIKNKKLRAKLTASEERAKEAERMRDKYKDVLTLANKTNKRRQERVRVLEEALSDVYALDVYKRHPFTCGHYMTIAILCDDYLDKSGALLGRVRERAKDKARQALGDTTKGSE